ncbi:MAG: hypothetical protein GXP62_02200, partial [Oligoflexia bacterium]|nr:hypothetical protein [Oligoflexia bacterium]
MLSVLLLGVALGAEPGAPLTREQLVATTRLSVGQAMMGAYLLGPHLARLTYDPQRSPAPYYLGALGGVLVGAGSGIYLGTRPGFDLGQAKAILSSELLGGATGTAIGFLADPYDQTGPAWGTLAGAGVGAGLGLWLASKDPTPAVGLAAQSGAGWGLGLVTAGIVFAEGADKAEGAVVPLVAGADAGAVLGAALAYHLDLSTRQLALVDLGGVLGTGAGLLGVGIVGWWYRLGPQAGAVLVTVTGVGGGVVAALLTQPGRGRDTASVGLPFGLAALSGEPGALRFALPV